MSQVVKIDANNTGARFALETSLGVLPAMPVWMPLEPNSYKSFGSSLKKVARNPINAGRQNKFGIAVDSDVTGGFQEDLTYTATQRYIQGLFYANFRAKQDLAVATVDAANGYEPAMGGDAYHANDIVFGSGFANAPNNGIHVLTAAGAAQSVKFAGAVSEAGAANGAITRVGVACAAGDIGMTVTNGVPSLNSQALDFTTLGLIAGEWIFIGGDAGADQFANANCNGYARINNVAAHALTLDKTTFTPAADAGAGKTLKLYFGRVIKNESDPSLQVRRTYSFERTLGAPDDAAPANLQAEYLSGCGINEYVATFNTADKITEEVSVVGSTYFTKSAAAGLLPGTRPNNLDAIGFNTTSHLYRAALTPLGSQTTLFAYCSVAAITVNNGIKANKALGVFGGFDFTAGNFDVSATMTAYFQNTAALDAVANNEPVSFDVIVANNNHGIVFDLPLVSAGENGLQVAADQAILVPLTLAAGDASTFIPQMSHTMLITYFDYLPTAAMPALN